MRFIPNKIVLLTAAIAAVLLFSLAASAQASPDNTAKIRAFVSKINGSRNTRISLEKFDGSKVRGRVSDARVDTFVVTTTSSSTIEIAYADVRKVSRPMSLQAKLTLISGLAAATLIVTAVLLATNSD